MFEKLKGLINFFPLIFIILSTLGYINLQAYYYFFNIEILNYLELSEIILLFFNTSILLIAGIIFIVGLSFILDHKIMNEFDINNVDSNQTRTNKIQSSLKIGGLFILILIVLQILFNLIIKNYMGIIFPIGFIICGIVFFVVDKYFFNVLIIKSKRPFLFFTTVISFFSLLLINLITITNSMQNAYDIRYNHFQIKQLCFSYNSKTIKTSEELLYIGETKSALFLFDSKNSETIIFKIENIDYMRIK
jgi:hypothetical protein